MTARTMLRKIKSAINAKNDRQLSMAIGLAPGEVSRIMGDETGRRGEGMMVHTLQKLSTSSGIPIGTLAEWWAEEEQQPPRPRRPLAIALNWRHPSS